MIKKKFILFCLLIMMSPIKIWASELPDSYIDITFDSEIKENEGHGVITLFDNSGKGIYGNNTITYGEDKTGKYMAWTSDYSNGGGFNLDIDKVIGEEYTIALKFSFMDTGEFDGGWKKIIDFQKDEDDADSGLYFYDYGKTQFYPEEADGPQIKNNEVVDLLIRRNKVTNKFEVYNRVNDKTILCYEFTDDYGLSILGKGLGFFHNDDYQTGEYSSGGRVYAVKIWDEWINVEDALLEIDKSAKLSIKIGKKTYYNITGEQQIEVESLGDINNITVLSQDGVKIEDISSKWSMSTNFTDNKGRRVLEVQIVKKGEDFVTFNLISHYRDYLGLDIDDFMIMGITARLPVNPKTLDNLNNYIVILLVSLVGIGWCFNKRLIFYKNN